LHKTLEATEPLIFGYRYYFWTFDYCRGNKVYLGRHTRHGHEPASSDDNSNNNEEEKLNYIYTLGLRPCHPNQTWEMVGGNDGDVVMWRQDIGLSVGGENPKARQPDSDQRCLLSCFRPTTTESSHSPPAPPSWCVRQEEWGPNEKLQLLQCNHHHQDHHHVPAPQDNNNATEKELIIHAIPEVCDEGEYLLHSPTSRKDGSVYCEGYHVVVDFHFWIEAGVMYFCAPALPFCLGIPILDSDVAMEQSSSSSSSVSPLANLLEIKSARWGCVIYYMAVAADVSEGKSLDMERFLSRVTDHEDHKVVFNGAKDLVYIDVRGKRVLKNYMPALPRDDSSVWQIILSW
jgi:hypothetical protein